VCSTGWSTIAWLDEHLVSRGLSCFLLMQNFGKDNFYGPPYALLQGSLADLAEQPPFEGNIPVKKGKCKRSPVPAAKTSVAPAVAESQQALLLEEIWY
jgi:hypothetical protein